VGSNEREHLIGPAALLVAISFWGFVTTATRYLLETFSPAEILALRFGFGAMFVGLFVATIRPRMPAKSHLLLAVGLGMFASLGYNVPLAFGLQHVEAGTAALLNGVQPVLIAVLAAIVLDEVLSRRMVLGTLLALVGSSLIAMTAESGFQLTGSYLLGCLLVILACVIWAVYSVVAKPRFGPLLPPMSVTMLGVLATAPLLAPIGAAGAASKLGDLPWQGWLAVALIAGGANVTAPALFNVGLERGQASNAALFMFMVPLIGVASSVALLGEQFAPTHIIGGALIITGVAIATFTPNWLSFVRKQTPAPIEPGLPPPVMDARSGAGGTIASRQPANDAERSPE
jgi:drug/metabolite transporter (DMT)-like permease